MNAIDILRAALTAAGCFGAVYLALRYRVPGQGTGTRNARSQLTSRRYLCRPSEFKVRWMPTRVPDRGPFGSS